MRWIHLEIDALETLAANYGPAMAERVMVETGKRLRVVHGDCNGATATATALRC